MTFVTGRLPFDTKLLLTKNYSEIIIFGKITNLTRNSLKKSLFPGDFENKKSLTNYEKNSQGIIFVIISCQRVKGGFVKGWFWRMCPRSGFRSGGTCECTLVPVFVPGEHPNVPSFRMSFRGNIRQNHPFGNHPFGLLRFYRKAKSCHF